MAHSTAVPERRRNVMLQRLRWGILCVAWVTALVALFVPYSTGMFGDETLGLAIGAIAYMGSHPALAMLALAELIFLFTPVLVLRSRHPGRELSRELYPRACSEHGYLCSLKTFAMDVRSTAHRNICSQAIIFWPARSPPLLLPAYSRPAVRQRRAPNADSPSSRMSPCRGQ